jgi:outer membrane protein OmpA-like peptidoglycan-associated protein
MKPLRLACVAAFGLVLAGCALSDGGSAPEADVKKNTFEVFFDVDSATISDTAALLVRKAAEEVKGGAVDRVTLSVYGNGKDAGWDEPSRALSERRADAIAAELVRNGVPPEKIGRVDAVRSGLAPTPDGVPEPRTRRTEIILQ